MALLSAFQRFCCERSRELYEFMTKEKKQLKDDSSIPGAVSNQESLGSETSLLLSKEQENHRYWENWGSGLCSEQQGALRGKGVLRNCRRRMKEETTLL